MRFSVLLLFSLCLPASPFVTPAQEIKIGSIYQDWVGEDALEVTVCLEPQSKVPEGRFAQLNLLIANGLGGTWHLQGMPQKTDRQLCFEGVTLEKSDLAKTLLFTVTENEDRQLIQGVETFVVVPEVTRIAEDLYQICWDNPENVTFSHNQKELRSASCLPNCRHCCSTVSSQINGENVILETDGSKGFQEVIKLHLPRNRYLEETPTDLNITEIHKVMRDDDPSGVTQNIKIVVDKHDPIFADAYELQLIGTNDGDVTLGCDELPQPEDTEIIFRGNFQNCKSVILAARNDSETVAIGNIPFEITDPGSKAFWVGSPESPSLRVDLGEREVVEVPGRDSCTKDSSPCYFIGLVGDPLPPPVMCEQMTEGLFCDDIVSEMINSPTVPALELHNLEELIVPLDPPMEVVVSIDAVIVSPDDYGCADAGDGTCSQKVEIGDDIDSLDVIIVKLRDDGFVESVAKTFEVYGANAVLLSPDVLKVSIIPRSAGIFTVQLDSSPNEIELECQVGVACRAWLAGVAMPSSMSVRKEAEENNTITQDNFEEFNRTSIVRSITSLHSEPKTIIDVEGLPAPARVELVTFSETIASEEDCEELVPLVNEGGYSMDASLRDLGPWEFIVMGYEEDGSPLDGAHASVTLVALEGTVAIVGANSGSPNASLRVDVGSHNTVNVVGIGKCNQAESPCYFLKQAIEGSTLRHCVTIENSVGGDVEQCGDSFTPFSQMTEAPKLELMDSKIMTVTVGETVTGAAAALEMVVFDPLNNNIISSSPVCTPVNDESCSQEVNIPEGVQDFGVLVVALDDNGEVSQSVLGSFHDLKLATRQLMNDMLEVTWTSPGQEEYSVSLAEVSPSTSSSAVLLKDMQTTCGEGECRVHFIGLTPGQSYAVKVNKMGDESAKVLATTSMDTPAEDLPPECPIKSLTTYSRTQTNILIDLSNFNKTVTKSHLVFRLELDPQETTLSASQEDDSGVFKINHAEQQSLAGKKIVLIFKAYLDALTFCVGRAVITPEDIDARLSWVGARYNEGNPSSLRVDTGSLPEVKVTEDLVCQKENSPCYFLEKPLPRDVPRCVALTTDEGQTVDQCDAFVNEFQGLREDPSLNLFDLKEMRLTLTTSAPTTELVISRPEDNTILSPPGFVCTEATKNTCAQPVEIPGDMENFATFVVLLDENQEVMESGFLSFDVYKAEVDKLLPDVFRVTLGPTSSPGSYTVDLQRQVDLECEKETVEANRCQGFFSRLTDVQHVTISKTGDLKSVTYSVSPNEPPPRSSIQSITSQKETSKTSIQVTTSDSVSRVDFVNFVDDVAPRADQMTPALTESGYSVDVPSHEAGKWDFVVLGYSDDGKLAEVGQAYVILEELDINVAEVWKDDSSSSIRVYVGSPQEVSIVDLGFCDEEESPCYFLQVANVSAPFEFCISIDNFAEDEPRNLSQCASSFTPLNVLPGDISLSLDGSDKMIVVGESLGNATEITVIDSLDPEVVLSHNDSSCKDFEGDRRCTQLFDSPEERRPLDVLVVAVDCDGLVLGSARKTYTYSTKSDDDNTWVIVVGVIAGLVALVLVILGVRVIVKKKKAKKSYKTRGRGANLSPAASDLDRRSSGWAEMEQQREEKEEEEESDSEGSEIAYQKTEL